MTLLLKQQTIAEYIETKCLCSPDAEYIETKCLCSPEQELASMEKPRDKFSQCD